MPLYDFMCQDCGNVIEKRIHMDDRDNELECELCHNGMKRVLSLPMAVLWGGKFHSPWAKKTDYDTLGPEW